MEETTLLELLQITSTNLVDAFYDTILENFAAINEQIEENL